MAVEAVSTLGGFKTYSSENATLATALSEVLNKLETQGIPGNKIQYVLTFDTANNKYAFVAICKMH